MRSRTAIYPGKKYSEATSLLYEAEENWPDLDPKVQYELRKNFGWARLGQKRYAAAEAELKMAIQIDNTRASAHCLLAQLLEEKDKLSGGDGKTKQVLSEWNFCLDHFNAKRSEEDLWYGMARQRLFPKGEQ